MEPPQPPLPRPPGDPENLRRLRQEAVERMQREESSSADPRPSPQQRPPAPVYGGPPIITRRWTVRGILLLIAGALAAIAAVFWGRRRVPAPVADRRRPGRNRRRIGRHPLRFTADHRRHNRLRAGRNRPSNP
jgi:hypothetical protein